MRNLLMRLFLALGKYLFRFHDVYEYTEDGKTILVGITFSDFVTYLQEVGKINKF